MKLVPVIKIDKRNKTTSKKFDDDVISANCDVIVMYPISGQFEIRKKIEKSESRILGAKSVKPTFS